MNQRLILLIFLFFSITSWAQQHTDKFLVKPYMQFSTKNSMTILWETKMPTSSKVEFGQAKFNVEEADLSQTRTLDGKRTMHEIVLDKLKEETNYFWRVVSITETGETIISETYSFKTTVKDESAFMFALIGDSQSNGRTPWAWDSIATMVWKERPSFIVHAGDLVDWGPKKEDWIGHFFPGGQKLMARVPMYTVLGNHEGDADYYYQYMANPSPEYRYTFKYGNAEFFMIDTNRDVSEGSDQYNWLEQALAKSTATWKIAIHHHPPYTSESDDNGDTFKEASTMQTHARKLTPLYDKYGVDFCLFGHTHVYERTWPLKDNRITQKGGTIYINSGGAGGGLETFAPTRNWFTLEVQEGHHFCTFAIYKGQLFYKAIDHQGRVFDSFQMTKAANNSTITIIEPPAPIINSEKFVFENETTISLDAGLSDLAIYYTTDGSEPSMNAKKYTQPFNIKNSTVLKSRAYTKDHKASRVVSKSFTKMAALKATKAKTKNRGLKYQIIEGDWRKAPEQFFEHYTSVSQEGVLTTLNVEKLSSKQKYWGVKIDGYININQTDTYTFYALDTRGVEIKIDDQLLLRSDGQDQVNGTMVLEKGKHKISIKSLQQNGRKAFGFGFYDKEQGRMPIKPFDLGH